MHLLRQAKLVAETKKIFLDSVSEVGAKIFTENKAIKDLEIYPKSSKLDRLNIVEIMQSIASQGNGHIAVVEVIKPINDKVFPIHNVEISFKGLDGNPFTHDPTQSFVKLTGKVTDPSLAFKDVEMLSAFIAKKLMEVATACTIANKGLVSKQKDLFATYDDSGSIKIWNDKESVTLPNAMTLNQRRMLHNNQPHMVDTFFLKNCCQLKRPDGS